jgi:hypothetical protein
MFDFIMAIMLSFTQPSPLPVSQVIAACGSPSELTLRVDNRIRF